MFEEKVSVAGRVYRITGRLGLGAFGEVFLAAAEDDPTVQVAVKQLYSTEEGGVISHKIKREVTALQQVAHANVITLLGVDVQGPCVSLVLELCLLDLGVLLSSCTARLPENIFKGLAQQILQALAACHAAGFLHRDIKPANLLITADGLVKLSDWGQACAFQAAATGPPEQSFNKDGDPRASMLGSRGYREGQERSPAVSFGPGPAADDRSLTPCNEDGGVQASKMTNGVGTRWYRAPELLYGSRDYGPAVDIWSAGMVLAEMLALAPLAPGVNDIDQLARLQQELGSITVEEWPAAAQLPDWHKITFGRCEGQPWDQLLPRAHPKARELLQKMLRYTPEARLSAADALADEYFTTSLPLPATRKDIASFVQQQHDMKQQQAWIRQARATHQAYWQAMAEDLTTK